MLITIQESQAEARVTRDSAVIPRWPSAAILDIIEPEIAPFDLTTPKPWPRTRCTVCEIFVFKLYCDLETGVWVHSVIESRAAPLDRPTDPKNLTLEANITLIGKTVAKLWPFLYIQDGCQPPSWILSNRK